MKKLFRLALFGLLFPTSLFSSHFITSYAEFAIDSATNQISIEYHVILDSTGIAFTQNYINVQGPGVLPLVRDTVIPFVGRLGGPFCAGAVYYEVIFKTPGGMLTFTPTHFIIMHQATRLGNQLRIEERLNRSIWN